MHATQYNLCEFILQNKRRVTKTKQNQERSNTKQNTNTDGVNIIPRQWSYRSRRKS